MRRFLIACFAGLVGACSPIVYNDGYQNVCDPNGREGIVSITWTVNGAAPSAASCAGVARLQLRVAGDCDEGVISPIPCELDKIRFDRQPYGNLTLTLEAIDASERLLYSGAINYTALSNPPAAPTTIALTPPSSF